MKTKSMARFLFVVAIIGAAVLNFPEFLMGGAAGAKNVLATQGYFTAMVAALILALENKDRQLFGYLAVWWSLTIFFALVAVYVNLTDAICSWAIPFVIVLLGPWYGLDVLSGSHLSTALYIAVIPVAMLIISAVAWVRLGALPEAGQADPDI